MTKLNPYLTFQGKTAQAMELYKKVFNVEPTMIQRYKDVPPQTSVAAGMNMSPEDGELIIHAAMQVGNDMLMLSDAPPGQNHTVVSGLQTQVSIHPDSREEADRMFALLTVDGGKATMPLAMQFWGDYFGMCTDKFGVCWMINHHESR